MKKIITVSREYGSGGREIGKRVAEKLGVAFYDKDIIKLAARESGFAADFLREADERFPSGGSSVRVPIGDVFSYASASYVADNMPLADQVHCLLHDVINEIADKEPCVIVGRAADYILRARGDCLNVFIHASREAKLRRVAAEYGIDERHAARELERVDKARAGHYRHYASRAWGLAAHYHVSLNSETFGIPACVDIIIALTRADDNEGRGIIA